MRPSSLHKPASARPASRFVRIDGERDWRLIERLRSIVAGVVDALPVIDAALLLKNHDDDLFSGWIAAEADSQPSILMVDPVDPADVEGLSQALATGTACQGNFQLGPYCAQAVVGLKVDDTVEGILGVRSASGALDSPVLKLLELFASQAAYAVEAAHADARREIEARHQETLFEVARTISSALDSAQILQMVAELMAVGVGSPKAAVYVWETDLCQLRRRADYGVTRATSRKYSAIKYDPDHPYIDLFKRNEPLLLDLEDSEEFGRKLSAAAEGTCALAVPLMAKDRLIALAVVGCPPEIGAPVGGEIDLLMAIAGQAAVSIENATLYEAQNQAATELAALYAVSRALAASLDLDGRLRVIAESIATVLGVSRCAVFLIEYGAARGYLIIGGTDTEADLFQRLRLGLSERETAMMRAIKEGAPTIVERSASRKDGYIAVQWRVKRMAVVPLISEGRTVGLAVADEPGHAAHFSQSGLRMAGAIGEHAALVVHNARLYEQTRQHAEDLQVLWEIGQDVSSETNEDDLVSTILLHLRRLPMAASATVALRGSGESLTLISDDGRRTQYQTPDEITDECDRYCLGTLESLQMQSWRNIRRHDLPGRGAGAASKPVCTQDRSHWPESPTVSVMCVPIVQGGEAMGAITVFSPGDHDFSASETRLLGSVSSIVGSALQRAKVYGRERRIAETLQRSFLSEIPESMGAFSVADRYAAALDESRIGGDFYDIFALDDSRVAVVIGDVSGKGLSAAIHTASAKYMLRSFAFQDPDPGTVMAKLNDALCFYSTSMLFITLFYAVLNIETGEMVYANAGHEPPLHWVAEQSRFASLAVTGRALGFLPSANYLNERASLSKDDTVLLFTDGVTEARNLGAFFEATGLRDASTPYMSQSANTIADEIESQLQRHTGGQFSDDYALLVIKRVR